MMIDAPGEAVREGCRKHNLPQPFITIEPGWSIVGPAGVTLYRVGSVKHTENVRTYVAVDGGMPDNPVTPCTGASYQAVKATDPKERTLQAAIAGRCCESGDLVTKDALIQPVQAGICCVLPPAPITIPWPATITVLPRPPSSWCGMEGSAAGEAGKRSSWCRTICDFWNLDKETPCLETLFRTHDPHPGGAQCLDVS